MGCNVSKDVKVEDQGEPETPKTNGVGNGESEMSEEKAAEKIQASFRGYKVRKSLKGNEDPSLTAQIKELANVSQVGDLSSEIQDIINETIEEKEELNIDQLETVSLDLTDAELEKAATKIQASFRNFSAKKQSLKQQDEEKKEDPQIKEQSEGQEPRQPQENDQKEGQNGGEGHSALGDQYTAGVEAEQEEQTGQNVSNENEEEEVDIDLEDPQVEKAALKIQATFRGYKVRKEIVSEE